MNSYRDIAYEVRVYVAGDSAEAKRICAHWCYEIGCCVTVTETEFIYTGGRETGAIVGMVNYPRFPDSRERIWSQAEQLAERLIVGLAQHSALVQGDEAAQWMTRRDG